ncbi:helix-turn-helix domain-containing protein [Labrys wisconsinensis]|uniref:helix-turn-helix domain-containing protein n=1 Tax=Labrys wisconsinensis TaxID=425677 RepID=UPI0035207335
MSKQSECVFSATFKAAVAQMEAGRKVAPLARELGVARQSLYRWHAAWRAEGIAGFGKRPGRKPGGKRAGAPGTDDRRCRGNGWRRPAGQGSLAAG